MTADDPRPILEELERIQRRSGRGDRRPADLQRARAWIGHADNDVRWQALIAVGDWIETDPEAVWEVVLEHGRSEDDDMRAGVACVLLEHLLEHHHEAYFPKLRAAIERDPRLLGATLRICSRFGETDAQWAQVEALLERFRDDLAPVELDEEDRAWLRELGLDLDA